MSTVVPFLRVVPQLSPPLHYCAVCERYDHTISCKYCQSPMEQTSGRVEPLRKFQPCDGCRSVLCQEFEVCAKRPPPQRPEAA